MPQHRHGPIARYSPTDRSHSHHPDPCVREQRRLAVRQPGVGVTALLAPVRVGDEVADAAEAVAQQALTVRNHADGLGPLLLADRLVTQFAVHSTPPQLPVYMSLSP